MTSQKRRKQKSKSVLAFSGGSDSMYLLHLLLKKGEEPILAHLNHRLRGTESDKDEQFCKRIAKKHGLTIEVEQANLKKGSEEEARIARYNFLERVREKHKAREILTAHHLNDSIETILFNLTRGTGVNGLTGVLSNRIKRPLLETTKQEILIYLKKHKIKYREDASNRNTKFSRNRIRLKVIPELKKINPNLEKTFLSNIENFKTVQDFLNQESSKHIHENHLEITNFKKLHPAIQTNIILTLTGPNTSQKEVLEIRKTIIANRTGTTCKLGQIQYGKLMFKHNAKTFSTKFTLLKKHPVKFDPKCTYLNFDKIKTRNRLEITSWEPGDQIKPIGMKGTKKLQDIFTDKKIPRNIRKEIPIIKFGNKIIAVGWLVISDEFKVIPKTKQILKISFKEFPGGSQTVCNQIVQIAVEDVLSSKFQKV